MATYSINTIVVNNMFRKVGALFIIFRISALRPPRFSQNPPFKVGLSYNSKLLTFSTDSFNFFSADLNR